MSEFIELTSIYDGRRACIRAACIEAVVDNAEEQVEYSCSVMTVKPSCRTVYYSGGSIDVSESYDEICAMIYSAEL